MTPLIREMVRLADAPEKMMWFDIGQAPESEFDHEIDGEYMTHLPFQRMAVCGLDASKRRFVLHLIAGDGHVAVSGFVLWTNNKYEAIDVFAYIDTPDGVRLLPHKDADQPLKVEDCRGVMATIAYMLDSLDAGVEAYQPTVKANSPTNKRRIANGEPALIFDWRTVVIEPKQDKSESLGGTHASPRQHERRGHWRVTASGRKVWVRNCKVGNASNGVVFHDYKVIA